MLLLNAAPATHVPLRLTGRHRERESGWGGADVTPAWDSAKKHLSGLAALEAGKANLTSPRPPGFPDLSHLAMASLKRWGVLSAKSQPKCIP